MVRESNQNVCFTHTDASRIFTEFEISEFRISRVDSTCMQVGQHSNFGQDLIQKKPVHTIVSTDRYNWTEDIQGN